MTDNLPAGMTHTVGFYNGAKWPIQLVISRFNITLMLQKGEYILNPNGDKINDPFFEIYVENKQLSKEMSDTPVPIIAIPLAAPMPATAQSVSASPVRATSKFGLNERGIRTPILPKPTIPVVAAQAPDHNPVIPMTMEEAKRLGFARKIREVPEDYGATDTAGKPNNTPPPIRYSMDPSMLKKPAPLPTQLLKVESKEVKDSVARAALITQMAKSSSVQATPESANVFLNQTVPNAPANSPIRSGMPRSVIRPPVPQPQPPIEMEPEPVEIEPEVAEEVAPEEPVMEVEEPTLPDPDLQELQEAEQAEAQPEAVEPAPPKPPLREMARRDRYICAGCSKPFKFRSQLDKHAQSQHKQTYAAIMAAYPPENK